MASIEAMPASLWRRLGGVLYDSMLLIAIWMLTLIILVPLNGGQAVTGAWVQTLLFLEMFGFFAYFWRLDGQTVGMMAWRLRILSNSGAPLSHSQVLVRFITAGLSIACLGLGYWWALVHPMGRTWQDLMSDSHVVVEPKAPRKG